MREKLKVKKTKMLIYTLLVFIIVLSITYILKFFLTKQEAIEESNLLNSIELEKVSEELQSEESSQEEMDNSENDETDNVMERMLKIKKLKETNEDIVGWIEIEGTSISYPVLQGDDNEYYLNHNYKKEKSEKGSIFLDADYDWNLPSSNLLIYGHNISNGQMFQDLLKYEDEEFYKEHPIIRFTTESEDTEYEIISVFKSRAFYKSETNVFRYYDFINAETEEEYNEFVKNAKDASIYDIDTKAEYGEELITLITCSYHTTDGKFVVIGKEK